MPWNPFDPRTPTLPNPALYSLYYSDSSVLARACSCMPNTGDSCLSIGMNCEIAWNLIVNCIFHNVSDRLHFSVKGGFKFSQGSFIAIQFYFLTARLPGMIPPEHFGSDLFIYLISYFGSEVNIMEIFE
jgi:hypothetical protein